MIDQSTIDKVRERVDIAQLIRQYIPLRRMGVRLVARCPFHSEKTASFSVSPQRGMFYCYGCKASGDAIAFYQRMEGAAFPEAVEALAELCGVEFKQEQLDPQRIAEERRQKELYERLYSACDIACSFFEERLQSDTGEQARGEILARGISNDTARLFRLGYAPAEWNSLLEHLVSRGVSPADAEQAGLVMLRGNGGIDRFRHRIMFPVFDRQNRICAFSGRIMAVTEDIAEGIIPENPGKYINSPETPIYRKSETVYGLQIARNNMVKCATATLVEGNFDVVAMHEHGFADTICPLGTAFTEQQAKLLRRFAETVTIIFDHDAAGKKATRAALSPCEQVGLVARVAQVPDAKDPDELLRMPNGKSILSESIDRSTGLVEWIINETAANAGESAQARTRAIRELLPTVASIKDGVERGSYISTMANMFFVAREDIEKALRSTKATKMPDDAETSTGDTSPFVGPTWDLVSAIIAVPNVCSVPEVEAGISAITDEQALLLVRAAGNKSAMADVLSSASHELISWIVSRVSSYEESGDVDDVQMAAVQASKHVIRHRAQTEVVALRARAARAAATGDSTTASALYAESIKLAAAMRR